jgi:hypothetical protein
MPDELEKLLADDALATKVPVSELVKIGRVAH